MSFSLQQMYRRRMQYSSIMIYDYFWVPKMSKNCFAMMPLNLCTSMLNFTASFNRCIKVTLADQIRISFHRCKNLILNRFGCIEYELIWIYIFTWNFCHICMLNKDERKVSGCKECSFIFRQRYRFHYLYEKISALNFFYVFGQTWVINISCFKMTSEANTLIHG